MAMELHGRCELHNTILLQKFSGVVFTLNSTLLFFFSNSFYSHMSFWQFQYVKTHLDSIKTENSPLYKFNSNYSYSLVICWL